MKKHQLMIKMLLALLLIISTVCVYVPHIIYFTHREYFSDYFLSLISRPLFYAFAVALLILVIVRFAPLRVLKYLTALALVFSLLLWLQADFFAVSYGVLDGSQIDFDHYSQRGIWELTALIFVLLVVLIFYQFVNKHISFIVLMVLLGQLTITGINVLQEPKDKIIAAAVDEEFFKYSTDKNIILIVLDTFGSRFFQQALSRNPGLTSHYNGFVSYRDAISNYPATMGSVPSMLTGKMIPQDIKFNDFMTEEVAVNGLPTVMEKRGFIVSVISVYSWFKVFYQKRYMFEPALNPDDLKFFYSAQLFDFSSFRVAPHFLKPHIYNGGLWNVSRYVATATEVPSTFPEKGVFILDMMTNKASLGNASPRFKMIHVTMPHPEYIYNEDCEKDKLADNIIDSYYMYQQSVCALKKLNLLLERFKTLGIYDDSLIVVTSDHGARLIEHKSFTGFPSYFEMNTSGIMFMIKGQGQTGDFVQVNQPFSLIKLYGALSDASKHDSQYADLIDLNRQFYAFRNDQKGGKGYLADAPLFTVKANHANPKSWQLEQFIVNDCESSQLPINMTFKTNGREQNCSKYGFRSPDPNGTGSWTQSVDSRIVFNLDESQIDVNKAYMVSIGFKPNLTENPEGIDLTVKLNDQIIGTAKINSPAIQSIDFKFTGLIWHDDAKQVIELSMPDLNSQLDIKSGFDSRKLGLFIHSLKIKENLDSSLTD